MNLPKKIGPFFRYFIREQQGLILWTQFFALAWSIDQLAWPYIIKILIDKISVFENGVPNVWSYLALPITLGLSLWIMTEVFFRLSGILTAKTLPKMEASIRLKMFEYVIHHSYRFFSDHFTGSISNKISDMTQSFSRVVELILHLFVPVLIVLVLSILFFSLMSPLFGIILGLWIVAHYGICFYFSKSCDRSALIHSEARSNLAGKVVDALANHASIRMFAKERWETKYLAAFQKDEQQKHFESLWIIEKMKFFLGISSLIGPGILLNGYMLYSWGQGNLSSGDVIYIFNTTWNVMLMSWIAGLELPGFFKDIGIAKQALSIIQTPHEVIDDNKSLPLKVRGGEIAYENITYGYNPSQNIFEGLSLTLRPGEKVGLVGLSGAGKTTFVHLLLRYHDLNSGKITIDGQDISKVTLASLHDSISFIPQDPSLFHRTIWDNIAYGKEGATPEEILHAAKQAKVDDFVQTLPMKYETEVGERGIKISGGQRQRITIARALLKDAPILVLDEATSALDSVTEQEVQEGFDLLMKGRTSIVIAHRLSTLADMDRILVFESGKIVEAGSREELMEKRGLFSRLWTMQAGGFLPDKL
ncbi:MAG: ABC transporter ATP-binding protein [Chlamydiia bacterium]|nr:ABC transporter ATP-binding protein [Chlamydiia bacterium]